MKKHFKKNSFRVKSKYFTLIELLVVVFIIGILATVIAISIISTTKTTRDAKRRDTVKSILDVYSAYYYKNGTYNITVADEKHLAGCPSGTTAGGVPGGGIGYFAKYGGIYTAKSLAQCLVEDGFLDKIPSVQFSLTTPEGQQEFRVWSNDFNRYICASTVLEKPETADNKTVDTLQAITGYPTETEAKSYVCGSGLQVCYAKCTGATSLSQ